LKVVPFSGAEPDLRQIFLNGPCYTAEKKLGVRRCIKKAVEFRRVVNEIIDLLESEDVVG
jgi:hypothetical protein